MRIWIDLANSPHVPFFRALANEFINRKHEIVVTARDFAETVGLAEAAGLAPEVIGGHGGGKFRERLQTWCSGRWPLRDGPVAAISIWQSATTLTLKSWPRALSLTSVTLMDYEHQPANHMAFRMASRVIVPSAFPEAELFRFGANPAKVRRYTGLKEDVYLADFLSDPQFEKQLSQLGVGAENILVTVRPPASEALYHRFTNELFDQLLDRLLTMPPVRVVLLPRNDAQRQAYSRLASSNLILPSRPLDGGNLIAHSDLVVSAGGTINREAAALGIPAASIYLGQWAAIDENLVNEGRLQKISTQQDVRNLLIQKKGPATARRAVHVAAEVANLILDE